MRESQFYREAYELGKAKGMVKQARKCILVVLTIRFNKPAAQSVAAAVNAIDNIDHLNDLSDTANCCETPDEFCAALAAPPPKKWQRRSRSTQVKWWQMTEAEWLECADPTPMLNFLLGKVSDRKLRLFACSCCRRVERLFCSEYSRKAIDAAESYADGLIKNAKRQKLYAAYAEEAEERLTWHRADAHAMYCADAATICAIGKEADALEASSRASLAIAVEAFNSAGEPEAAAAGVELWELMEDPVIAERIKQEQQAAGETAETAELAAQAELLRDIVGNPFHDVELASHWQDQTVVKIAKAIYTDRAFDQLPILADALEDAGCDDAEILAHCRGPGPHVRGCWVVDRLLNLA